MLSSFRLVNQRQPGKFVLFSSNTWNGRLSGWDVVAQSPTITFANPNEPTGVHIALTEVPGQVRVSWSSWNTTATGAVPVVRWGATNGKWLGTQQATTTTYTRAMMCPDALDVMRSGVPLRSIAAGRGYFDPGQLHSAVLSGLAASVPNGRVFYQVGSATTGWSATFSFLLPPRVGAPTVFAMTADMGQAMPDGAAIVNYNSPSPVTGGEQYVNTSYFNMWPSLNTSRGLAYEVSTWNVSLVLHNGDISYAMGYLALWDEFIDQIQPYAANAFYMTVPGNHEHNWPHNPYSGLFNVTNADSGGECGVPFAMRFPMPAPAGNNPATPWYSYDYGVVHFISVSTEHPYWPGTPQYQFVAADLAAAAARRDAATIGPDGVASAPRWIVFSGHRPFYIDSIYNDGPAGDGTAGNAMIAAYEPLWLKYGVDLTLVGHHHSYQRSYSLANATVQPPCADGSQGGVTHVVAGHGGAGLTNPLGGPEESLFAFTSNTAHGYGYVIANATALSYRAIFSDSFSIVTSATMDKFTLLRPTVGPRNCNGAPLPPASGGGSSSRSLRTKVAVLAVLGTLALAGAGCAVYMCMKRHEANSGGPQGGDGVKDTELEGTARLVEPQGTQNA